MTLQHTTECGKNNELFNLMQVFCEVFVHPTWFHPDVRSEEDRNPSFGSECTKTSKRLYFATLWKSHCLVSTDVGVCRNFLPSATEIRLIFIEDFSLTISNALDFKISPLRKE